MKKSSMVLFLAAVTVLTGCGYTQKTVLPRDIKTIHVQTVKNKVPVRDIYIYVPGLEMDITNAVIRRMQVDGNLKVVPLEEADAVLEMDLVRFEQEGLRFTSLESVSEYRLYIVLDMQLIHRETGEVLWHEANFSGDDEYFVSDIRTISQERAAEDAVDRLAVNVVDRIVEDW